MALVPRSPGLVKEREEGAKDPYAVDYNEPQRSVSEDGTTWPPPLRAVPDAPAASWDVAAYKTAPPPSPAPAEPVTAGLPMAPITCRGRARRTQAQEGQGRALGQEAFTRSGGASPPSRKARDCREP